MSTIQLDSYRGVSTVMSTELNSLAATTGKAISSAVDNSANLDLFDDLELTVTFAVAPVVGTVIEVYLITSLDGGSTYADGDTSVLPQASLFVGGFAVRAVTSAQRMHIRGVALPPGPFKYLVQNTTAQAFPASGSVLSHNPYQLQSL